jgi:hypothetical protein
MPRSGRLPQPASGPAYIRGCGEVQDRLTASLIGEEIPDLEPALTSPCLLPHLCPQSFLLAFPVRAALKEVLPCLGPVSALPALSGGLLLRPHEVLASETVTRLQLVDPRSELLVGVCWARVGLLAWFPESAVSVFLPGNLGFRPNLGFPPLDLCDRALQVCQ